MYICTEKSLNHTLSGLVEYALSHDDFLSNISLNVVHYIQIPRGPRGIIFFRIAKIKLHQKKEEVTTVQKIIDVTQKLT